MDKLIFIILVIFCLLLFISD